MVTKTSNSTLKYMTDGIRYVCENFKNRAPGTESEHKAQEFFRDELGKYSDKVEMEEFDLHPKAFMGFIPIAALFLLISVAFYWLAPKSIIFPIIAVVLDVIAVLMFLFQFLFYRSVFDFLFPKGKSYNVMARRAPKGEVKRRIIFGGHADAPHEWTYSYIAEMWTLVPTIGGAIFSLFINLGCAIYAVVTMANGTFDLTTGLGKVLGIASLVTIPFCIAIMFFINWKVICDGANDNLSACYAAMGVLKEMDDNDFRFENTEVCCFISGSEEAGLRGAKAYARRHKKELQEIETVFVAMDTMREIEQLQVYHRGCTFTVHNDEAVADLIHDAGVNVGVDMPRTQIYPGAVDAEGFSMYGLSAAGFCGVNHDAKRYYHTRQDTADNISPECISLSLDICREAARLYNEKGGIQFFRDKRKNRKHSK